MKRFTIVLLGLLLLSGFAAAAGWLNDYEDGLEKARKENKLVLMMYVKKT